jgi:hypothetical protein
VRRKPGGGTFHERIGNTMISIDGRGKARFPYEIADGFVECISSIHFRPRSRINLLAVNQIRGLKYRQELDNATAKN